MKNTTELYLIRHAQSKINTTPDIIGGRSNETPLSSLGIRQSKKLGRALLAKGLFPDDVFCSPARRTKETAKYSLTEMGLDMTPHEEEAIQELSQGIVEGENRDEIYTDAVLEDIAQSGKDFKFEGGESMNEVGLRMSNWVFQTFAPTLPEELERYFVYTHGGAIKYLASHIQSWSHAKTYETEIDNTSVNLFVIENGECKVKYLNREAQHI